MTTEKIAISVIVFLHSFSLLWSDVSMPTIKFYATLIIIVLSLVAVITPARLFKSIVSNRLYYFTIGIVVIILNMYLIDIDFYRHYGPDIGAITLRAFYIILFLWLIKNSWGQTRLK